MATFSERKRSVHLARGIRTLAIIVVLGTIVVVGERMPMGHAADHAAAVTSTTVTAPADYFPSHFATPKGEPEAHVESF
ncbi:MAG TPA: hypothetical protein VGL25_16105 [Casimicrobiaceae bacterium]|jgi:hypothetical protein